MDKPEWAWWAILECRPRCCDGPSHLWWVFTENDPLAAVRAWERIDAKGGFWPHMGWRPGPTERAG